MRVLIWLGLAVVIALALFVASNPALWLGRLGVTALAAPTASAAPASGPQVMLAGQPAPPAPRESPAEQHLEVEALEAAARYAQQHDSLALIVTRHGYIVYEKYWHGSNLDTPIASEGLGRVLAALTVGVAISERRIGWPDEQLSYFIPEWVHDPRGEITVRNLLQSSSGLGKGLQLQSPPGKQWRDQDTDPDLLGHVIALAAAMPYPQYLSRSIWARIGAGDATFRQGEHGDVRVDTGFVARQGDWLRIAELLLQNGNYQGDEVIVPRWVPELLQPNKTNPDYASYLRLGTHPAAGASAYAASDTYAIAGPGARLWLIPSLQIAVLRTVAAASASSGVTGWDEGTIPNMVVHGARDFVPGSVRPGSSQADSDLRQLVPNH